jgi:anthranilate phosphoribosyltransferase
LCNPAGATYQILGTGREDLQAKLAATLVQLPNQAAIVVRGTDGMDEVSLGAETSVLHIQYGMTTQLYWDHRSFGLPKINNSDLLVDGPEHSAQMIRGILQGQHGPARDIVVANAAAGLWVAGKTHSLIDAAKQAQQAIDTGRALQVLERLAVLTQTAAC